MANFIISKITTKEANSEYQGAILKSYTSSTLRSCQDHALHDLLQLDKLMRSRLEWSDIKLLRSILVFVDTQSWLCKGNESNEDMGSSLIHLSNPDAEAAELEPDDSVDSTLASIYDVVDYITSSFKEPLEKQGVGLLSLRDEIEEVVCYSKKYFALHKENYQKVWYKLHTTLDAKKWPNVLLLCELIVKRTNVSAGMLRDLLEIKVEGPAFDDFRPRPAVELWWKDCKTTRRSNQLPRKEYRPHETSALTCESSTSRATDSTEAEHTSGNNDTTILSLEEWNSWFKDNSKGDEDEIVVL